MSKGKMLLAAAAAAFLAVPFSLTAAQAAPWPVVHTARALCSEMGLAPGDLGFTYCSRSLERSARDVPPGHMPGYYAAAPVYAESSFYGSNKRLRESRACAGLGLPVGTRVFGQCVANLDATMTSLQNRSFAH